MTPCPPPNSFSLTTAQSPAPTPPPYPGQVADMGTSGPDDLHGTNMPDVLHGLEGADNLWGGKGGDILFGGPGTDHLYGEADNDLLHGDGDVVDGGAGTDTLQLTGTRAQYEVTHSADDLWTFTHRSTAELTTARDVEWIYFDQDGGSMVSIQDLLIAAATNGADTITGNDGDNVIDGLGGDDELLGGKGNDSLNGGVGSDNLHGGPGDDVLSGGYEALAGGKGGGPANELPPSVHDNLWGGDGNDTLTGGSGSDQLYGGAGDDRLISSTGSDLMDGGPGHNSVAYLEDVQLNLQTGRAVHGGFTDTLVNITDAAGSGGADTLVGNDADNQLDGGYGDDVLRGGAGNDMLIGGKGHDQLFGDGGDDTFIANSGLNGLYSNRGDEVDGGSGTDTLILDDTALDFEWSFLPDGTLHLAHLFNTQTISVRDVELLRVGGQTIAVADIPRSAATEGDDVLQGDAQANYLFGLGGDDRLDGGAGDDRLAGSAGNDRLDGGPGDDTLIGGTGADTYILDSPKDQVQESWDSDSDSADATGRHIDTVELRFAVNADYQVPANVERVLVFGSANLSINVSTLSWQAAIDVVGSDGPNVLGGTNMPGDHLDGGAGDDVLDGLEGADLLTGGAGRDVFMVGGTSPEPVEAPPPEGLPPPAAVIDIDGVPDIISAQPVPVLAPTPEPYWYQRYRPDTLTDFTPGVDTLLLGDNLSDLHPELAGQRINPTEQASWLRYDGTTGELSVHIDGAEGANEWLPVAILGLTDHPAQLGFDILVGPAG